MQEYPQFNIVGEEWSPNPLIVSIHNGKLLHFAPDRGTYTYFRYNEQQTVMVVLNKQPHPVTLELARFRQVPPARVQATEVLTGAKLQLQQQLTVPARGVLVLDIKP
jgi:hypothetical protein